MTTQKQKTYSTSDLAVAAYLKFKGLKLIECGRGDKFNFVFEDMENEAEVLALEFVNSDFSKYDDAMRSLKKMIYSRK